MNQPAAVADPAALSPAQARDLFRNGLVTPTAGWSAGYAQANLIIVPKAQAFDVLLFAQRNPKSCPILGVLDAGETSGPLLAGGDIRTDVPRYTVYVNGEKTADPTDITGYWRDDLVTFIVGCSFTFEAALQEGGIRMPFIVSWGDRFDGRTSGHIGHFADMMPTLCEMAGCDCPETDGVSLWPMISGRPEDQKEHGFLYWEFPAFKKERGFVAVRMGEWKGLIRNVADGGNHIELYRINEDTLEEHDLSDEHPDIVSAMWEVIRREHTDAANPLFHTPVTFPEQ